MLSYLFRLFIPAGLVLLSFAAFGGDAPTFKAAEPGTYAFNTGVLNGKLLATDNAQGITPLFEAKTGISLSPGKNKPGSFSHYRVMADGKRFGESARGRAKQSRLLDEGREVEVTWKAADDFPLDMTATYRWTTPEILDVVTRVTPKQDLKNLEVQLAGYTNEHFQSFVHAQIPRLKVTDLHFIPVEVGPLVNGTFIAFPRDHKAVQYLFDGRYDQAPAPMQLTVSLLYEAPMVLKRDLGSDMELVFMARPEECGAVITPYNKDYPDEVSGQFSVYFSLFGEDTAAGQTRTAKTRVIFGRAITDKMCEDLYAKFLAETK